MEKSNIYINFHPLSKSHDGIGINVKSIDMKRVGEETVTDELSINFEHRKTDEWLNDLTGKRKLKFKSVVMKANKIFQIQA